MKHVGHFIAGELIPADSGSQIVNPSNGKLTAIAAVATSADVDRAVAAACAAFPTWSSQGLQNRAGLMLDLRAALRTARAELVDIIVAELGKTLADAGAEVDRAIEVLGQLASIGSWYGGAFSPGVSRGVDATEVRFPIGVVAAISPFNFPVLIPVVQSAMAIACGNTVVLKPSDRDPSATLRLAEIFSSAGLPRGVLNVVLGGKAIVDRLIEHPDVAGISFVGSTPVAKQIRIAGVARNKRVQAFGGGKNHMVVLPDADLDLAADAAVSAAYGAAGQRCMAVSVVVAVGQSADPLVHRIKNRIAKLHMGDPAQTGTDVGPLITAESRDRIASYLANAASEGASVVADGRDVDAKGDGWFLGPSLVDHVRPGMAVHSDEIFGPVLSVVRAASYEDAVAIIAGHPLGNGAAIFTNNGALARRFVDEVEAGQIGVNVPIPFPVFFHNFAGWKDSAFTETKLFGPGAMAFHTRTKTVSARWPDANSTKVDLAFQTSN
ncbi:CoA-acylating methylmalonate-semialdehyde dehydrogenase [Bradyrhizobium sp. SSUT18]|uniref:CoA-acylating methylmalonate-semialdehyde dehydrogenase n=1 Tax=Bradyrhizobium sp. SSUT18 TaxID=3040602 RepID=UPI002448A956|nr:CoA-acylating methylmalonate-semialdehyde dehydrogenase [Bradyrhizobium sp. SSUT18]MDH2401834.1 CoA-acylating methylmalonate-semialdehyde dehydrogenase [Bradyrhizobium sp. SSUT18]